MFADRADLLLLSQDGYRFVAVRLHHADGLSALCVPTVNSYKRLASIESASGTTWSPVWKSYGDKKRTCVVRTVAGDWSGVYLIRHVMSTPQSPQRWQRYSGQAAQVE